MRIVSRIDNNVLNSARTATMRDLEKLFTVAPNMAAKTIRLFPQNNLSFFTEGLGEIYNISAKSDNFIGLNDKSYKWKLRGHQVPKVKFAVRVTGGAIAAGSTVGSNGATFIVAFESSYYNPREIVKLEDGSLLYILSEGVFQTQGVFEYVVRLNTNDATQTVATDYMVAGKTSGSSGVAYPEMSDRGYINTGMAAEDHVGYLTKVRYDWSWSADAAATKYIIEDTVNMKGQTVRQNYITDQLWMNALEHYHFKKEMALIYGKSTMDARGKCFLQDEKGQDIVEGDGLINQMHPSCKQNYTNMSISLIEDVLADMALKMPKRTGNTILLSTGMQGYKEFGRLMRAEHKGFWTADSSGQYVQTKNGKITLGAEYNSFQFQGNKIVVTVNNVFDHPANVSEQDPEGRFTESSKLIFIDASTYDGVQNIQMIAKDGRSFITGELDGIGGQDGKTSGKVATLLDGSAKAIIGTLGLILHNPYSSMVLEKKYI
jgi:hypothetical protein